MKLPTLDTPTYTTILPSTRKPIEYRPFLIKEEKVLLIAKEDEDDVVGITSAVVQVVNACTFDKYDVNEFTAFDIEYLFICIRAKSIGEKLEMIYGCDECEESTEVTVDLSKVKPPKVTPLPKKIMLTEEIGVIPKYVTARDTIKLSGVKEDSEILTAVLAANIESIFDADNVYPLKDSTPEEIDGFISSLTRNQVKELEVLLNESTSTEVNAKWTCKGCGKKHTDEITGLKYFF